MQLYTGAQINFGDLTPYFTYGSYGDASSRGQKYKGCIKEFSLGNTLDIAPLSIRVFANFTSKTDPRIFLRLVELCSAPRTENIGTEIYYELLPVHMEPK